MYYLFIYMKKKVLSNMRLLLKTEEHRLALMTQLCMNLLCKPLWVTPYPTFVVA